MNDKIQELKNRLDEFDRMFSGESKSVVENELNRLVLEINKEIETSLLALEVIQQNQ